MNMTTPERPPTTATFARRIGGLAAAALRLEIETWPKPGLVSPVDSGSHTDMDAATFYASSDALRPFFTTLAEAGAAGADLDALRTVGKTAERAMLAATNGVNTHRGAIFGLGLLCAAAGVLGGQGRTFPPGSLGACVRARWGHGILCGPLPRQSHGTLARCRHGAGGARAEAAAGFPRVYRVGLPMLRTGRMIVRGDGNAARVQSCFALIAHLEDTNLLHRAGREGLAFAQFACGRFLSEGGVAHRDWLPRATAIHREFVARQLSPGGSADLLAATVLVEALEDPTTCDGTSREYHPSFA